LNLQIFDIPAYCSHSDILPNSKNCVASFRKHLGWNAPTKIKLICEIASFCLHPIYCTNWCENY